jgi:alpha-glucosidase
MLAMYVVLESYLQMVCDYPEAYKDQPGFEFIKEVPTTWDETRVPTAKVNQWVTIARRKGTDWYVGTINNSQERQIQIPLSFLTKGNYTATIYSDATDAAQNPNHLVKQIQTVNASDTLMVHLIGDGGQVIRLRRE